MLAAPEPRDELNGGEGAARKEAEDWLLMLPGLPGPELPVLIVLP